MFIADDLRLISRCLLAWRAHSPQQYCDLVVELHRAVKHARESPMTIGAKMTLDLVARDIAVALNVPEQDAMAACLDVRKNSIRLSVLYVIDEWRGKLSKIKAEERRIAERRARYATQASKAGPAKSDVPPP